MKNTSSYTLILATMASVASAYHDYTFDTVHVMMEEAFGEDNCYLELESGRNAGSYVTCESRSGKAAYLSGDGEADPRATSLRVCGESKSSCLAMKFYGEPETDVEKAQALIQRLRRSNNKRNLKTSSTEASASKPTFDLDFELKLLLEDSFPQSCGALLIGSKTESFSCDSPEGVSVVYVSEEDRSGKRIPGGFEICSSAECEDIPFTPGRNERRQLDRVANALKEHMSRTPQTFYEELQLVLESAFEGHGALLIGPNTEEITYTSGDESAVLVVTDSEPESLNVCTYNRCDFLDFSSVRSDQGKLDRVNTMLEDFGLLILN